MRYLGNGTSDHRIEKFRKTDPPKVPPQNLGKLTSETTFGHSEVVFQPLLRTKRAFSQNPPMSQLRGSFPPLRPKNHEASHGTFFFTRIAVSSHMALVYTNYSSYLSEAHAKLINGRDYVCLKGKAKTLSKLFVLLLKTNR